jgi:hypothetical protein
MTPKKIEKLERYTCKMCGTTYTIEDYDFKSLFNPTLCPDCDREEYNDHLGSS